MCRRHTIGLHCRPSCATIQSHLWLTMQIDSMCAGVTPSAYIVDILVLPCRLTCGLQCRYAQCVQVPYHWLTLYGCRIVGLIVSLCRLAASQGDSVDIVGPRQTGVFLSLVLFVFPFGPLDGELMPACIRPTCYMLYVRSNSYSCRRIDSCGVSLILLFPGDIRLAESRTN